METVFLAQVVLGAVVVYVLEWIKRARWVTFITIETKKLNGFLAKAAALLMAVGIHYEFDATAGTLMITGLTNVQAVRTADIAGVSAVVFCRGKRPDNKVIEVARKKKIPILVTKMVMFDICAVLYNKGLKGVS